MMSSPNESEIDKLLGGMLPASDISYVKRHLAVGGSMLIKYDGKRLADERWTVVLTDGVMNEGFYRNDGRLLQELLSAGVSEVVASAAAGGSGDGGS